MALAATLAVFAGAATPALALRVCAYNLLNYDNLNSVRDAAFQTVIPAIGNIDVLSVEEMQDQTAVNNFLNNVLNAVEPGQWAAATYFDDPTMSFNQALFYRPSTVTIVAADTLGNAPRDISYYTFHPVGYTTPAVDVTIFATHFKASSGSTNEATRLVEAQRLRLFMNTQFPAGSNLIVCGDFNMYNSGEPAYQELTGSQADNDGRMFDPLNAPGTWHNNASFSWLHTQSTRTGFLTPGDGGSTGGVDDRFDFILTSAALNDGVGLDQIASTYRAFGEDGNHFNQELSAPPTIPEGQVVQDALERASDHLPVLMDFQVPALVSVSPQSLDFGTVVLGGAADLTTTVTNVAVSPADVLDYSFTGAAGFTVPAGMFAEAAGGGGDLQTISMDTTAPGVLAGTVQVASDDPDNPSVSIAVGGTVVAHAAPSLSGLATVLADTSDFGAHEEGFFTDLSVQVSNLGFGGLQALLEVYDAQITGGGGRFSIVGGFSPVGVGATAASFGLHFDDAGTTAAGDTTYTATLVFSTRDDQALPGAANRADLTVTLTATVQANLSGLGDDPTHFATLLRANHPNPFAGPTHIAFQLAREGSVRLTIYDIQGRRVRRLVEGGLGAGDHDVVWDGRNDAGRAARPGIYFYSL